MLIAFIILAAVVIAGICLLALLMLRVVHVVDRQFGRIVEALRNASSPEIREAVRGVETEDDYGFQPSVTDEDARREIDEPIQHWARNALKKIMK